MGALGASRGKSEDPLMGEHGEITPYRMNQLMKAASKMTDQMVNGALHITYQEMEIMIKLIQCCMEESKIHNEKCVEVERCS